MQKIKIEKGIPIPESKKGEIVQILSKMVKNDSVLIPRKKEVLWRTTAWKYGIKIAGRKESEQECRLWKV